MTLKLNAKIRTLIGKKAEGLRAEGKIPAVIYGHGIENKNLELDYNEFDKAFKEAGESTIIDLEVDGKSEKVIISDVQFDSIKDRYSHIDFHQIKMDEKLNATIELKFIGEPKAVKELGGVFVHNVSELEIRCLPADLISEIEVDISGLEEFGDAIKISNLNIPDKIEIVGHHETGDVVATVIEPREEKVVEETPAEGETDSGEATEEGKESAQGGQGESDKEKKEGEGTKKGDNKEGK